LLYICVKLLTETHRASWAALLRLKDIAFREPLGSATAP
jgi:hypothetical protein